LLLICYVALVIASVTCGASTPILAVELSLLFLLCGTAWWASRSPSTTARVVHDFAPYLLALGIFLIAGPIIGKVNATRWDETWTQVDARHFPRIAWAWHHAFGRPYWLTDIVSMVYISFYAWPLGIAIYLYVRAPREVYEHFVFSLVVVFCLTLFGYFLFPTSGPRVPPDQAQAVLGGGAISRGIRAFLQASEYNTLDAFPSGHTSITLVWVVLGGRFLPRARIPLVILGVVTIFATVYLSFHYVVDVVAGACLAGSMMGLVPLLRRALLLERAPDKALART
jgi:membrane-associated phospholipid phosphatase